jgi:hypothetical protein
MRADFRCQRKRGRRPLPSLSLAKERARVRFRGLLFLLPLLAAGCASLTQVRWTRIDGAPCITTKVKPVWYSSETETDCLVDGKAAAVATNHEDLSIIGGFAALLGVLLPAAAL